jgi:hypothetical protein
MHTHTRTQFKVGGVGGLRATGVGAAGGLPPLLFPPPPLPSLLFAGGLQLGGLAPNATQGPNLLLQQVGTRPLVCVCGGRISFLQLPLSYHHVNTQVRTAQAAQATWARKAARK